MHACVRVSLRDTSRATDRQPAAASHRRQHHQYSENINQLLLADRQVMSE